MTLGVRSLHALALSVSLSGVAARAGGEDIRHLTIGDPARRDREIPLVLDAITETAAGDALSPADLPARLSGTGILFVGEGHTEMESHRVERRVLEELSRAGRTVVVGLEMFPCGDGGALDSWSAGHLTEDAFPDASLWYRQWGYPWGYYRDVFLAAQRGHLRMVGVNVPRETVSAVRQRGFDSLNGTQRSCLPERLDSPSAEQMRLFRASFEDEGFHSGMSDNDWKRLLEAQTTWDAAMGWNAVRALVEATSRDPKAIVVVFLGAGHVQYGLGAERQARLWTSAKTASLLPVAVRDPKVGPVSSVRASLANFVWGVPDEGEPLFPELGIATLPSSGGPLRVVHVEKNSPAETAALAVSDEIVSIDGTEVRDREAFNRVMASKAWGDVIRVAVRRNGALVERLVALRRRSAGSPETADPSKKDGRLR